jgi:hypothetical protein
MRLSTENRRQTLSAAEEYGTGGSRDRHQMNGISLFVLCEYSA